MRVSKSFILILALVVLAIPLVAQTRAIYKTAPCTLASLKGNYGGFAQGTVLAQFPDLPAPPYPGVGVAMHTFDGAGNWSMTYAASFGGVIVPWGGMATGTYTVTSDCEVTVTGTDSATGLTATFVGTITGRGLFQEVHLMYTDPYWVNSGTLRKAPRRCWQASYKGIYAVFGQGYASLPNLPPLLPGAHVGLESADGAGSFSGQDTVKIANQTMPDTFTGQYTVNPDCTVSATVTTALGALHFVGTITEEGRFQEIHTISVDPGWVFLESVVKR